MSRLARLQPWLTRAVAPNVGDWTEMARSVCGSAPELLSCPVMRGEDYCAEQGIERIDLLKLDDETGLLARLSLP